MNCQHDEDKRERIIDNFLRGLQINEHPSQELTFEQFYNILHQHPQALESLYLISIPNQDDLDEYENSRRHRMWMYIRNNLHRISFLLVYILTTVALVIFVIVYRVDHEQNHNGWQVTARIGGELVNFHFALAVALMLKETVTIIRRIRWLRRFIPVDDYIDAHRIVGNMLFFWTMIHIFGHIVSYATHTTGENQLEKEYFQTAIHMSTHMKVLFFSLSRTYMGRINVHYCGPSRMGVSFESNNWHYSPSSSDYNGHLFTSVHSTTNRLFFIISLYS